MTNLEKILEMRKKVDEMGLEVLSGINIQREAINKSRHERAVEMYEYFEELRTSVGADTFRGNTFILKTPFKNDDDRSPVLRMSELDVEFTMFVDNVWFNWRLKKEGKTPRGYEFVVDAWTEEYKEVIENELAEWLRQQTQKQIDTLKKLQTEVNKASEAYGLEVR